MQQDTETDPFKGSKYEKLQDLGNGAYGSVKKARNKTTNDIVAIKVMERGQSITQYVERELCNHRLLAHDHIIRFYEAFLTDRHLCIVMEYAAGGNLFDHIKRHRSTLHVGFTEDDARWFFWQLMVAVDYCHRQNICSRDIKLENTLVTDHTTRPLLKLCDFGFSKNSHTQSAPHSRVGTVHYMAPEVLKSKQEGEYDGKAADIWSCGVMLYAMLFRSYPFSRPGDKTEFEVAKRIPLLDFIIPSSIPYSSQQALPVSYECGDLLKRMLWGDPHTRITMRDIFKHPWFLKGCDRRVLTMNDYIHRSPNPQLQSEEELKAMVRKAAEKIEDEFSHHFDLAFSEEQRYGRSGI